MKQVHLVLIVILFTLAVLSNSLASTIRVPKDQPTIQAGINAAQNGDKVVVAPGTYVENINFLGKAITVKSSRGPTVTTIDGNAANPVVAFVTSEGASSILSGFTLQNGFGTFAFNYEGGGVAISYASPTIKGNIITANKAGHGGGIGAYGGSPVIRDNTITANYSDFGGGVAFLNTSNAQLLHNTISDNFAGSGGAVEFFGAGRVVVRNNQVLDNSTPIGGQGGGFWIVGEADEIIVQNLFANNVASSGSQIYSLIPQSQQGFAFINNTLVSAPNGGADAALIADGFNKNVLIKNNIIYATGDNAALLCNPSYTDGPPVVQFNDAFNQSLAYGDSCAGFDGANGNISGDPLLVNVAEGEYQLSAASPAVNSGTNFAPHLGKDILGQPRIVGGTIDMGAYEYQ